MTILDRIVADTRALVARRKGQVSIADLEDRPLFSRATLPFEAALRREGLSVIAEVKRASPSKGVLRPDFDPVAIARQYEHAGAAALSILTEPTYFQGTLDYLARIRPETTRPLLRKDFIIDPYQLYEARAFGADAVLLIAAVLDRPALYDLHQAAGELGLACLVEVYAAEELDRIDFDQVTILGVNNRDLRTFEVEIEHSLRLFADAPPGVVKVSESGLGRAADLAHLSRHGVDAVLIGETFMRAPHPGEKLKELRQDVARLLNEKARSV